MKSTAQKESLAKLTTSEDNWKEVLFASLVGNFPEQLYKLDFRSMDLNIFHEVEGLQFIDRQISPLVYCAYYGKSDVAQRLLKNKFIDVDLETPFDRQTPLGVACLGANYEMVKLLLDHGAEVNKPNSLNQTPLVISVFRLIEEHTTFQYKQIFIKIIKLLLSRGADPNWVFEKNTGHTLLHFLCSSPIKMTVQQKNLNYFLVELLMEAGALPLRSLKDEIPADLVQNHCNKDSLAELLKKPSQRPMPKSRLENRSIARYPEMQDGETGEEQKPRKRWYNVIFSMR